MTPEEVAAVTAVTIALEAQRRAAVPATAPDTLSMWVDASRRSAQRALLQRGPWRLSGRLGRRSRI
jgi:Acyl-CoA carboxylase epsilon subunit